MTEREICLSYQRARNPNAQLEILAELNGVDRKDIIKILIEHGEKLPRPAIKWLHKRLDMLKRQIAEREQEYKEKAMKQSYGRLETLEAQIVEREREYREIMKMLDSECTQKLSNKEKD